MKKLLLVLIAVLSITACQKEYKQPSAEVKQAKQTRKLQAEANRQIGMPNIVNFTELGFAKMILELRDEAISTYTYFIDMNGKKHFICESVGYGLPYSVQFTNPEKVGTVDGGQYGAKNPYTTPQADPNGLYMPDGLSATWVLCSNGKDDVMPVYVEPQIMVSPFKMH